MEKHLITLSIRTRVEPEEVATAVLRAVEEKHALVMLGTKGSMRTLFGAAQVGRFTQENYAAAAKAGLLYVQPLDGGERMAFSPGLDEQTGLPVLLQGYEKAFAMRSPEGPKAKAKEEQAAMDLKR